MSASVEKLKAAQALIARPDGWTRQTFSIAEDGTLNTDASQVRQSDKCFCIVGAIIAVTGTEGSSEEDVLARAVYESDDPLLSEEDIECVYDWNDAAGRTQAEVVSMYDKAIALAEAGES